MKGRRFQHLLESIGTLRHPCDLDLLLFFHRRPRSLLTSERLAAYVGYDVNQIARSLDLQSAPVLVGQPESSVAPPRLENPGFLDQIGEGVLLLVVPPARKSHQQ